MAGSWKAREMKSLETIEVVGVHPIIPTSVEFETARDILHGENLTGEELESADRDVAEHFKGLCLIEIDVQPPDGIVDWISITQPIEGKSSDYWQAPWDERKTSQSRWAFFLHFVQLDKPLQTSIGLIELPKPSPLPPHLAGIKYDLPG
jgi:hypothetical protein